MGRVIVASLARMRLRTLSVAVRRDETKLQKPTGGWACDAARCPRAGKARNNCAMRNKNALPQTTVSVREVTERRGQGGMKR